MALTLRPEANLTEVRFSRLPLQSLQQASRLKGRSDAAHLTLVNLTDLVNIIHSNH
jgi:hypothetical protein